MADRRLPERSTRGKRLNSVIEEEEDADNDFWNQEFFKEEAADDDYVSEKEEADVVDSDFDDTEGEEEEEGDEKEEKRTRKSLKPPGYKKLKSQAPKTAQPKHAKPTAQEATEEAEQPDDSQQKTIDVSYEVPTLRRSTRDRVAEAERERQRLEKVKPKRRKNFDTEQWRPLNQEELLEEAARTEVRNTESLQQLLALEEETKKKAVIVKERYAGPLVRFLSHQVDGHEETLLEVCNTRELPAWLRRKTVPPPPRPVQCVVTGRPAMYRDPVTGMPYSSLPAFKKLRSSRGLPNAPKPTDQVPTSGAGDNPSSSLQREGSGRGRGRGRRGRGGPGECFCGPTRASEGCRRG